MNLPVSRAKARPERSLTLAAPFVLSLTTVVAMPAGPAVAACVQSGSTVTCSGATNTGFGTGAENNLAVTVQSGASIDVGNAQKAIDVDSGNTAINNGAIVVGNSSKGIKGIDNNVFTINGTVILGTSSTAMDVAGQNNILTNAGTISSTAQSTTGLLLIGAGNTAINSGTISLSGTAYGIAADGATILNSGTITVGSSTGANGAGVFLLYSNALTNTGTITAAGANGVGVSISGAGNTVTNSGLIAATGADGLGVVIDSQNNTVVNNGTVRGGTDGYSLRSFAFLASGNSVTNNGTLDGRIELMGSGDSLINAGLITITDPGTALAVGNFGFSTSFTQTAQGTLALRVDNTGLHDSVWVGGTQVNLNGTLRAVVQAGLYGTTTTYKDVLATSASVNSRFATVTSSSAFFNAAATYNANSVDLILTRQGFGAVAGETQNQRAIGNALEAGYSTALTGATATFYAQLLQAGSLRVLDQLSGEGTSGTQNTAFNSGVLFGQTMEGQMEAWRAGNRGGVASDAALGYAAEQPRGPAASAFAALKAPAMAQPRWNAWAAGFGAGQQIAGNASVGSASLSNRAAGGAMGVDYLVNPDLLLGMAAGGSSATFSVDDRATSGRLEGGHVGAYAMQRFGANYLSAQIAYSHFSNTTTRTITGVGTTETAQGSFGSDQLGGRLEIGRSFDFGIAAVTPFAAIQAARLWQGAYTEASTAGAAPGVLGLSYAAQSVTSLPTFLGAKFDGRVAFGNDMVWSPFVHAAWVHEFRPSRTITASLVTVPVSAFTIAGASAASDSARLDLGSRLALNRWWEVSARVTGEFSNLGQSYSGMGALKASW